MCGALAVWLVARDHDVATGGHVAARDVTRQPLRGGEVVVAGKPVDLTTVMARTHLAFRQRDNALVGGGDNYRVEVHGATFAVHPVGTATPPSVVPLELTTTHFGAAPTDGRVFTRDDDGQLARVLADGVIEHLRNGHTGVEQSWGLEHAPDGPIRGVAIVE